MKPGTSHWIATSDYDYETAKAMLASKRYVYVIFMCHLSVEKALKAAIVEFTDMAMPPKIHTLRRLADLAGLVLSEDQRAFLDELTAQQQRTRYPEDLAVMNQLYTRHYAQRTLKQTKEFRTWLVRQIKSNKS
jgi:HEPN domain-containing protein